VRLGTPDLEAAETFATACLGLQVAERSRDALYLRSDDRAHTLCYREGDPAGQTVGFEVADEDCLQQAAATLESLGHHVQAGTADGAAQRKVKSYIGFNDPTGNSIELVVRPERSGRRYFPTRDAGIVQFHGVGLRTTDHIRDLAFWRALGAEVSDWVGDIAYLRIDGMHHRIALYPSKRNGLLYAAFEVEALDQIMQNSYFMQESQIKIVQGPGREAASRQIFLHVEGPDGLIFSYVNGMAELGEKPRLARQFPLTATSLCDWGSESKDVPELSARD